MHRKPKKRHFSFKIHTLVDWVQCTFGIFNLDSLFHQKLQELLKIRFSWTELKSSLIVQVALRFQLKVWN